VRLLLDTHVFLWAVNYPEKLSKPVRELLVDPAVERWVSAISLVELAVKVQKGKLELPLRREFFVEHLGLLQAKMLAIEAEHSFALFSVPRHHGDPFDRLLIAQAQTEGLTIATKDEAFGLYDVPTVW
jgi:PIN domain nuclease of toxin-antitoxin system